MQLSVRVPAELRRLVREVADADGIGAGELVELAVRAELARRTDPAAAFAADVAASLQRRLAEALADGTWEVMVDEIVAEDPDLEVPGRSGRPPACS